MRDPDGVAATAVAAKTVAAVYRHEYGRCVATLVRVLGDIDLAEEAVQDAFAIAVERWPAAGLPPNPGAWITITARNRAIDRLRREATRDDRHAQAALLHQPDVAQEAGPVRDDQLRLIFTCCHPALAPAAQVALTLRLLGGLETTEIARAFLVPEPTMAQRIVRAKRKIKDAAIPYRIPTGAELPRRLPPVLAVLYLVFNEGYAASAGAELVRAGLCAEAIRLTRELAGLCRTSRRSPGCSGCSCSPSRGGRREPHRTARWCCCPTRTGPAGTGHWSPRGRRSCGRACAATDPARTRSRRRSRPCTRTRRRLRTPTGPRSWPSTTSSTRSHPPPS
jgi:RNA polymerase sigma factor (sigma-70 family)